MRLWSVVFVLLVVTAVLSVKLIEARIEIRNLQAALVEANVGSVAFIGRTVDQKMIEEDLAGRDALKILKEGYP